MAETTERRGLIVYEGRWPKWRVSPDYCENAFTRWLEHRCEERRCSVATLARQLDQAMPGKAAKAPMGPYMTVYQWLRGQRLPSPSYIEALSLVLDTPIEQVVHLVSLARQQRAAASAAPAPTRASAYAPAAMPSRPPSLGATMRSRVAPGATPAAIRAAAESDILQRIRQMPEFETWVQEAIAQRLQAQQQGLAGRVGTETVPVAEEAAREEEAQR